MQEIDPIIEVLERNEALELDNAEQTYSEELEPILVDWDRLFPSRAGKRGNRDWEIYEDAWEDQLPEALVGEIAERAGSLSEMPGQGYVEYPEDVVKGERSIWDICAWYQPIHYFGYDWGIYIREDCLIKQAVNIASHLRLPSVAISNPRLLAKAALRASFATFFLHEHFHHKVESLGFRMHVVMGKSAYLPYKKRVYRPSYLTDDCLEEALANADAYKRLSTKPYERLIGRTVIKAAKEYLKWTFRYDPPGYRKAMDYLTEPDFNAGGNLLQGQVKEAVLKPVQPVSDWLAAKQLLRSYFSVRSDIYTVVNRGRRSILPVHITPKTCTTNEMVKLYQSRGYTVVPGGKGSHIKLKKSGAPTMILPGNRKELSAGVLKSALQVLGGYSINDLDRLIHAA